MSVSSCRHRRRTEGPGWTATQRRLHWWIAALIGIGFCVAPLMVAVPLRALLAKFLLYQLHKTIGLTVLALAAARLVVRARHGRPAPDATMPAWQRRAAASVHAALYALALITPSFGYLTAATAPAQVPTLFLLIVPVPHVIGPSPAWYPLIRQLHRGCAILLVTLGLGHAAAALRHHRRGRPTLLAMWRG